MGAGTLWTCALRGDFQQPPHLLVSGEGEKCRGLCRPQEPGTGPAAVSRCLAFVVLPPSSLWATWRRVPGQKTEVVVEA